VAFDVVGTLFPLEPLRPRLKEAGFTETALDEWLRATHGRAIPSTLALGQPAPGGGLRVTARGGRH
jgi:hypothetical protein